MKPTLLAFAFIACAALWRVLIVDALFATAIEFALRRETRPAATHPWA